MPNCRGAVFPAGLLLQLLSYCSEETSLLRQLIKYSLVELIVSENESRQAGRHGAGETAESLYQMIHKLKAEKATPSGTPPPRPHFPVLLKQSHQLGTKY